MQKNRLGNFPTRFIIEPFLCDFEIMSLHQFTYRSTIKSATGRPS